MSNKLKPIKNYIEAKTEWINYPAKIINGEMRVFVGWVDGGKFNKFFPKPHAETFIQKREDIDSTHIR